MDWLPDSLLHLTVTCLSKTKHLKTYVVLYQGIRLWNDDVQISFHPLCVCVCVCLLVLKREKYRYGPQTTPSEKQLGCPRQVRRVVNDITCLQSLNASHEISLCAVRIWFGLSFFLAILILAFLVQLWSHFDICNAPTRRCGCFHTASRINPMFPVPLLKAMQRFTDCFLDRS